MKKVIGNQCSVELLSYNKSYDLLVEEKIAAFEQEVGGILLFPSAYRIIAFLLGSSP